MRFVEICVVGGNGGEGGTGNLKALKITGLIYF